MTTTTTARVVDAVKVYGVGDTAVRALEGVDATVWTAGPRPARRTARRVVLRAVVTE
ncbi:hypothetical protein ABZS79_23295 [Streptomyces griseoloalbus]